MDYEQDLLDEIEDARDELKRRKIQAWLWLVCGLVGLVLLIVGGWFGYWGTLNGVDTGGPAGGLVFAGLFSGFGGGIASAFWFSQDIPEARRKVRNAERRWQRSFAE